jgi:uncharacterized protein YidB (DUF937 family)
MGLDDLVKGVTGGSGGGGSMAMIGQVKRLVDQAGGVDGLVSRLRSSGLGGKAQSWVGNGDNEPVSGDELRRALGDDELRKAGVDPDSESGGLADMLPRVIDGLTPGGSIPGGDQVQKLLGKLTG